MRQLPSRRWVGSSNLSRRATFFLLRNGRFELRGGRRRAGGKAPERRVSPPRRPAQPARKARARAGSNLSRRATFFLLRNGRFELPGGRRRGAGALPFLF